MEAIDLTGKSAIKPATSYISTSLFDAVKLRIGKQGLAATPPQTIPDRFRESCIQYAKRPALVFEEKVEKNRNASTIVTKETIVAPRKWITVTYAEYAQHVEQAALILLHVGLQPRSSVGVLAFNCPEWFYIAFGTLRAGGVLAGIYPSNSAEAVYHVLDTSEATVCVVDDTLQMTKVRAVRKRLPRLRAVLQLNGPYEDFVGNEEGYYRWEEMVQRSYGDDLREELERREQDVGANECATLIYTSGTTGMPKAVMLSHDAVLFDAKTVTATMGNVLGGEVVVSFLPLNHVAAQIFDIFLMMHIGACLYFADRNALKGSLGRYLRKARPTAFLAVPRVYEKLQELLISEEQKSSFVSKYVMQMATQAMENYHMQRMERKNPSAFKYWLASCITHQVKAALGFDRCKTFLIGGAPTTEVLKRFFLSLDMRLMDLYGMSEVGGATNLPMDLPNLKTVGKAFEGIEVKIHNPDSQGHGEICVRSRTNFMGYLHSPEKTKETIKEDGWLYSGDIGYLDTDGNLYITGRIKELIITAGGENIPPAHIEELIKNELHGISNAVVVGDHKKYLTVLLTIKTETNPTTGEPTDKLESESIEWMQSLGLDYKNLSEALNIPADHKVFDASNVEVTPHPKILESIEEGINRANAHSISNAQRVQKFSVLPHDFSIPTGELGPTLKVRRSIVLQKYANIIEAMYK